MELREIIIVIGLLAIALIIWDGIRRMKRPAVRKTKKEEPYIDPEEATRRAQLARELPNGGARVRQMTQEEQSKIKNKLNFRERVPMLMERVEVEGPSDDSEALDDDIVQAELDFTAAMSEFRDEAEQQDSTQMEPEDQLGESEELNKSEDNDHSTSEVLVSAEPEDVVEIANDSESEPIPEEPEIVSKPEQIKAEPELEAAETIDAGPVEDLVIIHVMAPDGGELSGSAVLDLLITAGLRHGPMDIFHYRNPKGVTEFSLANCVHPGTFDPDAMNQLNTPGVTLFMQLPTAADAMEAFDHMYQMAKFLAKHLDAQVLDEDHSTVTPQRIEYYREKLRSFARSKLLSPH